MINPLFLKFFTTGFSGSVGMIAMVIVQVS